jgi:hypothetical protein
MRQDKAFNPEEVISQQVIGELQADDFVNISSSLTCRDPIVSQNNGQKRLPLNSRSISVWPRNNGAVSGACKSAYQSLWGMAAYRPE